MTLRSRRWWHLGWTRHIGRLHLSFCPSQINRPKLWWDGWGDGGHITLDWGNGLSDPVWSITWEWGTP